MRNAITLAAGLLCAMQAQAHDTWFAPMPATERGEAVFALGTGNQFPKFDNPVNVGNIKAAGCGDTQGRSIALRWMADRPSHVLMRSTRPLPADTALSCMTRLAAEDITITDNAIVNIYLDEIRASEAIRSHWNTLRSQGATWQERYTKLARIMTRGNWASGDTSQGLDVLVENKDPVLRTGDTLRVQVLKDGKPLPNQPIEFRSDLSPIGFWRISDAQGRLEFVLPLATQWLLRGVQLQPVADAPQRWESYFLSLSFEVAETRP